MNNFNQSSTGINIDCNAGYDQDMSQFNFDENIARSEKFKDYFVYINCGNMGSKNIDLDDLYKFDETRLNQVKFYKFLMNELGNFYSDLKELDIKDILVDMMYSYTLEELDRLISCSGIEYEKLYEIVSVTGYSQGDQADIIILTEVLKEVWGCEEINLDDLKTEISHYFYDSPMIVRCDINNEEFISEKFDGSYQEYDKNEFIEEILNNFKELNQDLLRSELEGVLPKSLEY